MSSESKAPKSPKSAPDAPTDMVVSAGLILKHDSKLPPNPESTYKHPILTAKTKNKHQMSSRIDTYHITSLFGMAFQTLKMSFQTDPTNLQYPNSCSRRTPMKRRLIILASK